MNTTTADFETLLRDAVNRAKESAPRAVDDLVHCASKAAQAVATVTGGGATLELVPVEQQGSTTPTYQLQLRKIGSEAPPSDLGIYRVSNAGYPVQRWYSWANWEGNVEQPDKEYLSISDLEGNFKWMLSKPESRLVMLVTFFQQQPATQEKSMRASTPKTKK